MTRRAARRRPRARRARAGRPAPRASRRGRFALVARRPARSSRPGEIGRRRGTDRRAPARRPPRARRRCRTAEPRPAAAGRARVARHGSSGEYVFDWHGRWRDRRSARSRDPIESPVRRASSARSGRASAITDPGGGSGDPRDRRPRRPDPRAAPAWRPAGRRAALRRPRRRLRRDDPRRRLAGRRGDADPCPGDGRPRHRRGGACRARSGATSSRPRRASGPRSIDCRRSRSSSSTGRCADRWRARCRPCSTALDGPRGRDRHRPADARLRRARPRDPAAARRPRADPRRRARRSRGHVGRGARPAAVHGRRPPRGRGGPAGRREHAVARRRSATWRRFG